MRCPPAATTIPPGRSSAPSAARPSQCGARDARRSYHRRRSIVSSAAPRGPRPTRNLIAHAPGSVTSLAPSAVAATPEGERRQLTVLFCDLVGSTPLSQQLDAEDWRDVVTQYQQAVTGAVTRFGGHVARYLGDGLLIYFGWPTAREDDPERAIRAGLAILDAMTPLNAKLGEDNGTQLAVRIGMHTGPVVIADGGEVFGETPNIAARVQAAAEPDTVVVTAATHRLVAGIFVVEDRGPQELKGVREPDRPLPRRAAERRAEPPRRRGAIGSRLSSGARSSSATLLERWERAAGRRGTERRWSWAKRASESRASSTSSTSTWRRAAHVARVRRARRFTEGHAVPSGDRARGAGPGVRGRRHGRPTSSRKSSAGYGALATPETVALLADFLGLPPPTPLALIPDVQRRKTHRAPGAVEPGAQRHPAARPAGRRSPLVRRLVAGAAWGGSSPRARRRACSLVATARPEFTPPWLAR